MEGEILGNQMATLEKKKKVPVHQSSSTKLSLSPDLRTAQMHIIIYPEVPQITDMQWHICNRVTKALWHAAI